MLTKEKLEKAVKESICVYDVSLNLNIEPNRHNNRVVKTLINNYNIDASHFVIKVSSKGNFKKRKELKDILVENSRYNSNGLKKRLYQEGIKERKCELCGQDENWHGKKMSLILDHINGIHTDNRLENLRIVCPNCNATLDTHCGKNKKINKCIDCGTEISRESKRCKSCSGKKQNEEKIKERPTLEVLKESVKKIGYRATGRLYGVSDNTIRKWIFKYEKMTS